MRHLAGLTGAACAGTAFSACRSSEPSAPLYQGLDYTPPKPLSREFDQRARATLRRGAKWLWGQQEADGSFRSRVYADLAGGEVCTPFVLDALFRIPRNDFPLPKGSAGLGLECLLRHMDRRGAVGVLSEKPLYSARATAYTLKAFAALRPPGWRSHLSPTVTWLESLQVQPNEVEQGHPALGGFIEGNPRVPRKEQILLVDLGRCRVILEALAELGRTVEDRSLSQAKPFVEVCKTGDAGFLYCPVTERLNKGVRTKSGAIAGYGTATADGILSMAALGQRLGEQAVDEAMLFLQRYHRVDRAPGIDRGRLRTYAEGLKGYYRAASAECFARFGGTKTWREDLIAALDEEQSASGRWFNRNRIQREDDPLIATAHAIRALSAVLSAIPAPAP